MIVRKQFSIILNSEEWHFFVKLIESVTEMEEAIDDTWNKEEMQNIRHILEDLSDYIQVE